jgi:hypothetical protein
LVRYKELERRNKQQAHRLDALETRVTMAETICSEQMRLNKDVEKPFNFKINHFEFSNLIDSR